MAVSKTVELGVRGAICCSSGNAAAALGAHASHVGMRGLVLVNAWADPVKLAAIHALRMQIVLLGWSDFRDVELLMIEAAQRFSLFSFVHFQNPWRHEGYKAYALENWVDLNFGAGLYRPGRGGPSFDQVLARKIGADSRFRSLQIGVCQQSFGEAISGI